MRWLITGGCGFIGRNLIRQLINDDTNQILVIDNLSVGSKTDLEAVCDFQTTTHEQLSDPVSTVRLLAADILDAEVAVKAARDCDVIVHLAANTGVPASVQNPRQDCLVNVLGTFNYLEAARISKVKRFIFASSGAPVGVCEPPIHEEMAPHPASPYGASKLAGEGYCSAYFHSYGVGTVALRFGNVYGPYSSRKTSVVAKFIKQVFSGGPLEIYGDGNQTRDFIYIDDLVNAIVKSATAQGIGGEVFQIATSNETTVVAMADTLATVLREMNVSDSVEITYTFERTGDVKYNYSDTAKAKRRLRWQAEVELKEGLRKTVAWFLGNKPGVVQ